MPARYETIASRVAPCEDLVEPAVPFVFCSTVVNHLIIHKDYRRDMNETITHLRSRRTPTWPRCFNHTLPVNEKTDNIRLY